VVAAPAPTGYSSDVCEGHAPLTVPGSLSQAPAAAAVILQVCKWVGVGLFLLQLLTTLLSCGLQGVYVAVEEAAEDEDEEAAQRRWPLLAAAAR
jgi:hypothetical protein